MLPRPYCYLQLCVLLLAVLQQPQEIRTFFRELSKDSEEMVLETQNSLSKITMLVLLLFSQHTPVSFLRTGAPRNNITFLCCTWLDYGLLPPYFEDEVA